MAVSLERPSLGVLGLTSLRLLWSEFKPLKVRN